MIAGAKDGIIDISLRILLTVRNYVPEEKQFDLNVLVSCENLIINSFFSSKTPKRSNVLSFL